MIEAVALLLGLVLLALVFWDLFQTIVVPRPTPGVVRIGRYLVRGAWRAVRAVGARPDARRERLLGLFAPAATIALLVAWLIGLVLGYGLVLFAMRDELRPVPADLGTAVYFGATSVLTLGFGDVVAVGGPARLVVAAAALSGLGVVALVVTFLFSLYGSYQRREVAVVMLQAKAGVPPSAVVLLESLARLGLIDRLPVFFVEWERWAAEVLDSHVAYPLLGFFRSSHDDLSWISALGTVLDTASLVLTTIEDVPRGHAELVKKLGAHLVEDITNLGFRSVGSDGVDRESFDAVCARLAAAGYRLEPLDQAWPAFRAARATYAERLETMAAYWARAGGVVVRRPSDAAHAAARGGPIDGPAGRGPGRGRRVLSASDLAMPNLRAAEPPAKPRPEARRGSGGDRGARVRQRFRSARTNWRVPRAMKARNDTAITVRFTGAGVI